MSSRRFAVDVRQAGGRLVVRPRGELDIATVEQLREVLERREPGQPVELDLRDLDFLDTSGLQLVVEADRRARDEGHALTIVRGGTGVQRVFEIAGLDGVLPFADPDGDGGG